jgi:hypothetical protein
MHFDGIHLWFIPDVRREINFMEILRLMLKNTPPGGFSGKTEKKERFFFLFLSQKERRKEKCSFWKEFCVLRVQFSKAELATKGRRPLETTCHFRESGQSF